MGVEVAIVHKASIPLAWCPIQETTDVVPNVGIEGLE